MRMLKRFKSQNLYQVQFVHMDVLKFPLRVASNSSGSGLKTCSKYCFFYLPQLILGKLSKMENVRVPRGFCLTKIFFEKLIDEELLILLRELEETSRRALCEREGEGERLATCCDNVQTKIKRKRLIFLAAYNANSKYQEY